MSASAPLIGHVDVDAFFAAVEQRDKPSLRGRPVVVGGTGPRGVVATASYEARAYGVGSAMPMSEARRRCPHAAILAGRFAVYQRTSAVIMEQVRRVSPRVEQVSLDEAYLTLEGPDPVPVVDALRVLVREATGLTVSVGTGTSKLVAKIASDLAKPDGVRHVAPGSEQDLLDPLPVRRLPGLGPATENRLTRLGVTTVGALRRLDRSEVVALLGDAHGTLLWNLAHGHDPRPVETEHETKSVSTEETFDTDLTDPVLLATVLRRMAQDVGRRLQAAAISGRTVTLKARYPDFTTLTRSSTLAGPTDDAVVLARTAHALLGEVDLARGVRLLGVGVSGLTPWVQQDLFSGPGEPADTSPVDESAAPPSPGTPLPVRWRPGQDVRHDEHGPGWVWGSGLGRVTVRFETPDGPPGPVRTLDAADPALHPVRDPITPTAGDPPPRPGEGRPPPPAG